MNYIFYDFETTGRESNWDQIIQVGAVLTNSNFQEIDRFEARCSLRPGIIPYPQAILVNKSTVEDLTDTNLSHFSLIELMLKKFKHYLLIDKLFINKSL